MSDWIRLTREMLTQASDFVRLGHETSFLICNCTIVVSLNTKQQFSKCSVSNAEVFGLYVPFPVRCGILHNA